MTATFELSGVDQSLARQLSNMDSEWLEGRLEALAKEYHDSRKGGMKLAPYDKKSDIDSDESISEAQAERLKLRWDREIGGRRR